jgi:hypothetical protein
MVIPSESPKTNGLVENHRADRLLLIYKSSHECGSVIVRRADNGRPGRGVYAS